MLDEPFLVNSPCGDAGLGFGQYIHRKDVAHAPRAELFPLSRFIGIFAVAVLLNLLSNAGDMGR